MSYDIFLSAPTDDVVPVADVLSLLGERVDARRTAIVTANGSAELYGLDGETANGIMVNHWDDNEVFAVLVELATRFHWIILAGGCPILVTSQEDWETVDKWNQDPPVVIVKTGRELESIIEAA